MWQFSTTLTPALPGKLLLVSVVVCVVNIRLKVFGGGSNKDAFYGR